ncbi:hypothetical protein CERZMDRAFT_45023 [Cercospora zeae-maydis SCOH1-5]|uniref:Aminoglycoside phosphotransferase domain-containing protein n=1 Tax=Cercospora zeae-maydis SCOH1-5 TaxID=717836 RepID=A0A6A6FBG7_9PEZI|nr:hypothetical protein CERZMDRAFT_45023 [Cercospora zeae-maydis SCOH1-5]
MDASSQEIAHYCAQLPGPATACQQNVRRLTETLIVKLGLEVTESEFRNQLFVYNMLEHQKIKVARPYRFVRASDSYGFCNGYLIMEYIQGQRLDEGSLCNNEKIVSLAASAIQSIHETSASRLSQETPPGSLFGSIHYGFPWGDGSAEGSFHSMEDLERCIQKRLVCSNHAARSVDFDGFSDRHMVLCHLDLAPRNLLLTTNDIIAVLDWASMGWFPSAFELASLEYLQTVASADEAKFLRSIKAHLQKLKPLEENDLIVLGQVHANSIRYAF